MEVVIAPGSLEEGPRASIEVAPEYVLGCPMPALVHLVNESEHTSFMGVAEHRLLAARSPIEITWRQGDRLLEIGHAHGHCEERGGRTLDPGARMSAVIDLSLGTALEVGEWDLFIAHPVGSAHVESEPVHVRVRAPSDDQQSALRELRQNDLEVPEWYAFVISRREPIDAELLARLALVHRELALHLFLRDAVLGDAPIAELDDVPLLSIDGPAEVEAAIARHEILAARGARRAEGIASAILERWPGVAARIEATREGRGQLERLRNFYRL